jgi:hypothetical protein
MLDRDLARLYGVSPKVLNQAVKRNINRFPEDFMFQLSWGEVGSLRSQFVTLKNTKVENSKRGRHIKYPPYAFTEHGVAMLSSVLNSEEEVEMDEREFWQFLQESWKSGRVTQVSAVMDFADPAGRQAGKYLQGHTILPKNYDQIGEESIIRMGSLLFQKTAALKTKEAVMILLAHQPSEAALTILARYNLNPDPELRFFAQMALEECAMWNE